MKKLWKFWKIKKNMKNSGKMPGIGARKSRLKEVMGISKR